MHDVLCPFDTLLDIESEVTNEFSETIKTSLEQIKSEMENNLRCTLKKLEGEVKEVKEQLGTLTASKIESKEEGQSIVVHKEKNVYSNTRKIHAFNENWSTIIAVCKRVINSCGPLFNMIYSFNKIYSKISFQTNDQSGTFKCARSRCKTCPFIHIVEKVSEPKRSIKIPFTCTSANVIYWITCTYCHKLYIGETGRRLSDRFREHLRETERNDEDASKPVARHFNLPILLNNVR